MGAVGSAVVANRLLHSSAGDANTSGRRAAKNWLSERKKRLNNFNNGFRGGVIAFSATSLLPFAGGGQSAVEEFGGRAVGADPIAPAEQVVNLAWRRVDPLNR